MNVCMYMYMYVCMYTHTHTHTHAHTHTHTHTQGTTSSLAAAIHAGACLGFDVMADLSSKRACFMFRV